MTHIAWSQRIRIGAAAIVWFLLGIFFFLGLPVLTQLPWWVSAVLLALALLLALPPFLLVRRLRRKKPGLASKSNNATYLSYSAAIFLLLGAAVGFPVYYLSYKVETAPLVMPQVTLANDDRTVVFQGMVHIGSENFYKSVVYDLEDALIDDYRLYYEGVMPSTDEANRWFSDTMAGGRDLGDRYKEFANACGMKYQIDYFGPLAKDWAKHPDRHITADVSTQELKAEYDRLMQSDPKFAVQMKAAEKERAPSEAKPESNSLTGLIDWYKQGTDAQKNIAGILCRGVLSIALELNDTQPAPLDPVILDFRNQKLVDRIVSDDHKRIYITYGAKHLPGVLSLLQSRDAKWQVRSVKWTRAIAKPEHFDKSLQTSTN